MTETLNILDTGVCSCCKIYIENCQWEGSIIIFGVKLSVSGLDFEADSIFFVQFMVYASLNPSPQFFSLQLFEKQSPLLSYRYLRFLVGYLIKQSVQAATYVSSISGRNGSIFGLLHSRVQYDAKRRQRQGFMTSQLSWKVRWWRHVLQSIAHKNRVTCTGVICFYRSVFLEDTDLSSLYRH